MEKIIEIDGKSVGFKASAATPYTYRNIFQRDLLRDMATLCSNFTTAQKALDPDASDADKDIASLTAIDLQIFMDAAWVMAHEYDHTISPVEEWLESFGMFSIYEVFPTIIDLWGLNNKTLAKPKKK